MIGLRSASLARPAASAPERSWSDTLKAKVVPLRGASARSPTTMTVSLAQMFQGPSAEPMPIGRPQNYLMMERKFGSSTWVYICTRRKALDISTGQFTVSHRDKEGNLKSAGPEHPLAQALRKANPWMTMAQLVRITSIWLDLVGNAFWLILRDKKGVPQEFYPINPVQVMILGGPVMPSELYQLSHFGETLWAKAYTNEGPGDILHFRTENPTSDFDSAFPSAWGVGPLEAMWRVLATDEDAVTWNRNLVKNDGRPSGMLMSDQEIGDLDATAAAEEFRRVFAGPDAAGKVLVLGKNLKYTRIGDTPKELDYVEARNQLRMELIATFGMKPVVLGLAQGDVGRRDEEVRDYWQGTVVGTAEGEILPPINEFLAPEFGEDIVVGMDYSNCRALQINEQERSGWIRQYWGMGVKLNDLIDHFKLPFDHQPGGEIAWLPMTLQPVTDEGPTAPPMPPGMEALAGLPPGPGGGPPRPGAKPKPPAVATENAVPKPGAKPPTKPGAKPTPGKDEALDALAAFVEEKVHQVLDERLGA